MAAGCAAGSSTLLLCELSVKETKKKHPVRRTKNYRPRVSFPFFFSASVAFKNPRDGQFTPAAGHDFVPNTFTRRLEPIHIQSSLRLVWRGCFLRSAFRGSKGVSERCTDGCCFFASIRVRDDCDDENLLIVDDQRGRDK